MNHRIKKTVNRMYCYGMNRLLDCGIKHIDINAISTDAFTTDPGGTSGQFVSVLDSKLTFNRKPIIPWLIVAVLNGIASKHLELDEHTKRRLLVEVENHLKNLAQHESK